MRRGVCYECGHRATWREAWRWQRERKRIQKRRGPEATDPSYFSNRIAKSILDEARPLNTLRFRKEGDR